jgi:hypothetical protein
MTLRCILKRHNVSLELDAEKLCEYCVDVFVGGSVYIVCHSITDSEICCGWSTLFFRRIKPNA